MNVRETSPSVEIMKQADWADELAQTPLEIPWRAAGHSQGVEAQARSRAAIPAVLSGTYEAFEGMLSVIRAHESRAEGMFAAFVMSAASAANGRDAVAGAPSLPRTGGGIQAPAERDLAAAASVKEIARDLAGLGRVLTGRLAAAASSAPHPADRAACAAAARHAGNISALLSGAGP